VENQISPAHTQVQEEKVKAAQETFGSSECSTQKVNLEIKGIVNSLIATVAAASEDPESTEYLLEIL
jgi:hypothetical protein